MHVSQELSLSGQKESILSRRLSILSLSSVYPSPAEPGLGLFVQARLHHLARCGADVTVIAPVPLVDYTNPKGKLFQWRRAFPLQRNDGLDVFQPRWIYPPLGTPFNVACLFLRLLPLVTRLWKRGQFDLIDIHFGYPEGVVGGLLAKFFRVPFMITMRGSELMFAKYRFRRALLQWALREASLVVTLSDQLGDLATELGVPADRIRKIPNGIDSAVFHPKDRLACRAKFGIHNGRKVIVSAGELIEAKGHHLVIGALQDLLARGEDAELWIAGGTARGGPRYEEQIRALIASHRLESRVHMPGWMPREPLAELINAADVLCLASRTEGWPNVVNEALSCGTPVIATRVGAVPEMIPGDDFGFVIPVENQEALSIALGKALCTSWDRRKIAEWGASRSWEHVAEDLLHEIRTLDTAPGFAIHPPVCR